MHLKPTIGGVKLDRLSALQVQSMYRQKLDGGLSARTVGIIQATLHKALKQAVRWVLVPRNVPEAVTPPRPTKAGDHAAHEGANAIPAGRSQRRQARSALRPGGHHRHEARRAARPPMEGR